MLHHQRSGAGAPTLVFIHGFSRNHSDWDSMVAALTGRFDCLALDLPGHGSSAPLAVADIPGFADAVGQTLAALNLRDVVLVGHSMGCRVAVETCRQWPQRVVGVIAIDGSRVVGPQAVDNLRRQVTGPGAMERFLERFTDDFYVASTPQWVRDFIARDAGRVDVDLLRELIINFVRWDNESAIAALQAVKVPLMVIQSTALDATMKRVPIPEGATTPWMTAVAEHVPGAVLTTVAGVGHFTMLEAPERTAELIAGFAAQCLARANPQGV